MRACPRKILLAEPGYRNKYPPLGLMKISSYHKLLDDEVHFVKGRKSHFRQSLWDRVYVSTLFTFHWSETLKTIAYYGKAVRTPGDVFVGGVMASLLAEEIRNETGATVIEGLLDRPGQLDEGNRTVVDHLIPDYQILSTIDYRYEVSDSYIAYATRGCPNRCRFCAVHRIEPDFCHYTSMQRQVRGIEEVYGPKQHLVLLDNNVLASDRFGQIVSDILSLGFEKGARRNGRLRRLDFNQGLDARRLTEEKISLLAQTAIRPLRIAFDSIRMKDRYISRIRLAAKYDLLNLSNYVLYNYTDTPADFYERLRINCLLNEEIGTKIYSFPMKYIPLTAKERTHVGPHWNRKLIRGVQCILLATRGMVSPRLEFFEAAFGESVEQFLETAMMPDEYIVQRNLHSRNGAAEWRRLFRTLTRPQKRLLADIHAKGPVTEEDYKRTTSARFKSLLDHYIEADRVERERRAKGK